MALSWLQRQRRSEAEARRLRRGLLQGPEFCATRSTRPGVSCSNTSVRPRGDHFFRKSQKPGIWAPLRRSLCFSMTRRFRAELSPPRENRTIVVDVVLRRVPFQPFTREISRDDLAPNKLWNAPAPLGWVYQQPSRSHTSKPTHQDYDKGRELLSLHEIKRHDEVNTQCNQSPPDLVGDHFLTLPR